MTILRVEGIPVHTDVASAEEFSCSNSLINWMQKMRRSHYSTISTVFRQTAPTERNRLGPHKVVKKLGEVSQILGYDDQALEMDAWTERIARSFNREYFDEKPISIMGKCLPNIVSLPMRFRWSTDLSGKIGSLYD